MAKDAVPARKKNTEEDELKSLAETVLSYVQEKPRQTAMAAVAIAVVVLFGLLASYLVERSEKARVAAVSGAIDRYTASLADPEADVERLRSDLEGVARTYASSEEGGQALYFLGGALAREGKHEESAKVYLEVHDSAAENGTLAGAALLGAAYSYAAAGNGEEALLQFRRLLEAESLVAPRGLVRLEIARLLKSQGDKKEAAAVLEELLDTHPDSPLAEDARLLLSILQES